MVDEMRQALEAARAGWGETGEVRIPSRLTYGNGQLVEIVVRKRGHR